MPKAIALALLLALSACGADSVEVATDPSKTTYSRDARTDVCFATLGRRSFSTSGSAQESFSIATVPCSPKVLALVPRSQSGTLRD